MSTTPESRGPTRTNILSIVALLMVAGFAYFATCLQQIRAQLPNAGMDANEPPGGSLYVPAYSHVYSDGLPYLLEVTLSVRNTDPRAKLVLTRADYYDTQGKLLRRYVVEPKSLAPLQSESFVVEKTDYEGGSGANFIVEWRADPGINRPLAEAVMIGIDPKYQISFVRGGVPVERSDDQARPSSSESPN